MRIVEFKCPHATTVVPDPHVEESDVPLKEHILENAVSGAVGVYTTLSIENGNSVSRRREELIELHTARLVRCILPIVCRETSESLYENVRDYVVMCLDAVGIEVMSESPTCMVVIVIWVALEGTTTGSHLKIERITMYVKEYTMKSIDGPNVACILGPPRKNPDIKDVLWMRDREYLEQLAPPGAADVLLCTEHGDILEGLVTNLFVVVENGDGSCVVQTAPVDSGVLWGTMRHQVIGACRHLSIPVEYRCPRMDDRHSWKEAFLTNSMRGVSPLTGMSCGKENVWGLPEWYIAFGTPDIAPRISQYLDTT